jgi:putative NADPH-quinone reductase
MPGGAQRTQGSTYVRILLLNAHPDSGSFCDRIADAYVVGAHLGGHQVEAVALRDLSFDLVLCGGYVHPGLSESGLVEQQQWVAWCEHLVVGSPNWWWSAPALLKGYIDRVFLPGFAMRYHDRFPYVQPLLCGNQGDEL